MPKKAMKKTAAKKTKPAAKVSAQPKSVKKVNEKLTKTELYSMLAEQANVTKQQVKAVLESMTRIIEACIKKGSVGEFTVPGLAKIVTIHKKATKARKGISPFTGEEVMFKAKPARVVVKVRALKKLKDMVS